MSIDLSKIQQKAPVSPKKKKTPSSALNFLNKDIKLFGGGLSGKKKERFYSEMNILFTAGVDIKTTLELMEEEQTSAKDKKLFSSIKEHILAGGTFSGALEKSGSFSPYEYYSIKIGEESGRLSEVLHELAKYYAGRIRQKRQIVSALSYPVIVFLTALGTIYFMLAFIVPMFKDVFAQFGGELPAITQLIVDLSAALSGMGYPFLLTIGGITGFVALFGKKQWYRKATSAMVLRLPLFGGMVQKIYLARFCHSMNLLTGANTPLIEAIKLVEKMIGFYPMETSLVKVRDMIMRGSNLHQALGEFPLYSKRMVSLIKVAEEVNQLDTIFANLAKQYNEDVEHQSGMLSSMLEPLLIIFIGFFVAVILVAMYLPLFSLSSTIG